MRTYNPEIKGERLSNFLIYLNEILIPDFKKADMPATAEDFELCVSFIEHAKKEIEENSVDSI
jgi:hypothetical protein